MSGSSRIGFVHHGAPHDAIHNELVLDFAITSASDDTISPRGPRCNGQEADGDAEYAFVLLLAVNAHPIRDVGVCCV